MNAIASPTKIEKPRAKSAKPAQLAVVAAEPNQTAAYPFWYEPTVAARNALSALLKGVREHDDFEENDRCTDALRVVSVASDLIDETMIDASVLDMEDAQLHVANVGFDAAALLIAADCYPDQKFGKERSALISHAMRILDVFTDLHGSPANQGLDLLPALQAAIEATEVRKPEVMREAPPLPLGRKTDERLALALEASAQLDDLVPIAIQVVRDNDKSGHLHNVMRALLMRFKVLNDVMFDAVIAREQEHSEFELTSMLGLAEGEVAQ